MGVLYDLKARKVLEIWREGQSTMMRLLNYAPDQLRPYEDLVLRYFFRNSRTIDFFREASTNEGIMLNYFVVLLVTQTLHGKGYLNIAPGYEARSLEALVVGLDSQPSLLHGYESFITQKAIDILPRVVGFRQFIETARQDEIVFHATGDVSAYIDELTPYAIVFNLLNRWRVSRPPIIGWGTVNPNHPQYNQPPISFRWASDSAKTEKYQSEHERQQAELRELMKIDAAFYESCRVASE